MSKFKNMKFDISKSGEFDLIIDELLKMGYRTPKRAGSPTKFLITFNNGLMDYFYAVPCKSEITTLKELKEMWNGILPIKSKGGNGRSHV